MRLGVLVVGIILAVCGAVLWGNFYLDEQANRRVMTGSSGAMIGTDRIFEAVSLAVAAMGCILFLVGSVVKPRDGRAEALDDERPVR